MKLLKAIIYNKRARVEAEKVVRTLLQKTRQGVVVVLMNHSNRSSTNNKNHKSGINICIINIAIIVIVT